MLETHFHGNVLELRLARPPVNALDTALLRTLAVSIRKAPRDGAKGIILSGAPGMFSAGVDVPALLALDRDGVRGFWRDFFDTCCALAQSPIPVVAAISGHAPAGGAVLSLFCDYRIMAEGPFRIGLNEVQVGLPVPEAIQMALRRVVGAYRAERLMVAGAMPEAAQALALGLVDELTTQEQVTTRARHWLDELLKLPSHAMLATRRLARADLMEAYADLDALPVDSFMEAFYHPETQATLKALVARLKNK
ncbi:enoyl-CoA hydratase/isomerase family protein [Oleiagrimonas sp. C23AA]|uniref:enoyl-CoA hydratase/isomerase family protein n=1 Tax=Oleiagrimonas sp. C23AA TaxID=2719047 RepID=UPI00141FABEE|nr:enoyl-CoA hydratase/isomerase family protein [Oleiagrimonas sp. C23AA]NII09146.1 enoyl-CoA hydratase/isomerase family protein [Oleiagrimonas sp. C23AA]